MYLKALVDIPNQTGKIVTQKKKDSIYVFYEYDRVYDPVKKYNIPKRAVIGKLSADDHSKMYPNPNFLRYFPAVQVSTTNAESSRSCCLRIGSWVVISEIIKHYGLFDLISDIVGKNAGLFLDLAAYAIVSEHNYTKTEYWTGCGEKIRIELPTKRKMRMVDIWEGKSGHIPVLSS